MRKTSLRAKISLILFSVFLTFILLEVGLRLGGFILTSLQEYRNRISMQQKGAYRILCLGESTTALGGKDSHPSQLEEILNQKYTHVKFSVINKGIVGITTSGILLRLEENLDKYQPDMVVAMMGINDSGGMLSYENIATKKTTLFFKSFRTYKLVKLLCSWIINKMKEIGIYKAKVNIISWTNSSVASYIDNDQEALTEESTIVSPTNDWTYIELGRSYRKQGNDVVAEEIFKKALGMNPTNDWVYIELGQLYRKQGNDDVAEAMFRKALEMNPTDNDWTYIELGRCYRKQGDDDKAEAMFRKALEINPTNDWAYISLARRYSKQRKYDTAEKVLKKGLEINPANDWIPMEFGWCYMDQKKYGEAEAMFKKAIEIAPENDGPWRSLGLLYEEQGKHRLAEEYFSKANRLRLAICNLTTRHNYKRLKEILTQRGIKLVCAQYPMHSVELLKKMLEPHEGIIFVDNEMLFKQAIEKASREEYFTDMFAGSTGHCTREGNKLLAENITNAILKECFNK